MSERIDLGHDHAMSYFCWAPDRDLNPQYEGIPDVERYGITVYHKAPDGSECASAVVFDGEVQRKLEPDGRHRWAVVQEDPLTLSPSLLCMRCGDHGFIRDGKWVPA